MKRGTAEWFKWYIHTCWEEEAGGLLAETHALALRKIERKIAMHKQRSAAISRAAAKRRDDETKTSAADRR